MASIASSNKYLSSAIERQKAVRLTIATSSAIEGIHAPFKGGAAAVKKAAGNAKVAPKASGISTSRRVKSAG